MKTTGQAFLCLFMFSLVMISCKFNRTSEIIGPAACPSDKFNIVQGLQAKDHNNNPAGINLKDSYAEISATFNESISYTLSITGQTSGAVFKTEEVGSTFNVNWYGNSTNGKYFKSGEVILVTLTNVCKSEPIDFVSSSITSDLISYAGVGLKVINFDESPAQSTSPAITAANLVVSSSQQSPQGGTYFHFDSTGAPAPTWFFNYLTFNGINYSSLGTDPAKVYLNFFAKGKANSQAQMIIDEMAHGSKLTRKFYASVSPDNWKLYSVRLSDIGILDPSQIKTLSVNFAAATYPDTSCEIDLDLVIFTKDRPF